MPPDTKKPYRPRRPFPRPLGEIVDRATKPSFRKHGMAHTQLLRDWPSLAGAGLTLHCAPLKLSFPPGKNIGGTLTLLCRPAFALELQHLSPLLIERLNTHFGYKAISRLAIRQGVLPETPKPTHQAKKPVPPNAPIPPSIAAIEDESLRQALTRLAQALHAQQS